MDKFPDAAMPRLTYTRGAADICGVANLAEAPEWAHGVDALTVGAEVWHHLTLINICGPKQKQDQKQIEVNIYLRIRLVRNQQKLKKWHEITNNQHS